MKRTITLMLLLGSSLTSWAQNMAPMVRINCPETTLLRKSKAESKPQSYQKIEAASQSYSTGLNSAQATCSGVINVNIHFMLRLDGTGNFNETNDGAAYKPWRANQPNDPIIQADTAKNGYARARALVQEMNNQAATNPMNSNPAGTSNPAKGFSYALNGVYFHRVAQSEYDIVKNDYNGYASTVPFDNYGTNKSGEINCFMMGDYTNGACCDVGGIACTLGYDPTTPSSYWVKIFNSFEFYRWRKENEGNTIQLPSGPYVIPQNSLQFTANTLGHEFGHLLGLAHVFEGANGCLDAAVPNRGGSGNNQMDYDVSGTALTPCQLGIVNSNLSNAANPANSYRNYVSTSYCGEVPPRAFFTMYPCITPGYIMMDSRGTFMAEQMTVRIYSYDPNTATGQGALLTTRTSAVSKGGIWNLSSLYSFVVGEQYYVSLTATRMSGQEHTQGRVIRVYDFEGAPCGPPINDPKPTPPVVYE